MQTDISTINDIVTLKAMIYDQLLIKEQAENNIAVINQRMNQVKLEEQEKSDD